MKKLSVLKPGDKVKIIAPASRVTEQQLGGLKDLLESWQLNCEIPRDIFGDDLFCANSDASRFAHLEEALLDPEIKAIISARGGYGSMRLIPYLKKMTKPNQSKIFVGMSDTTALQLFFQQSWQWPTIHGSLAPDRFSEQSILAVKSMLFQEDNLNYQALIPLNDEARTNKIIEGEMIGGNLSLIQASMGTSWQIIGTHKIILFEEVEERAYRVDRMLEQLKQAHLFDEAAAILLGDFIGGLEPNGSSLIDETLKRFASTCSIPVIQIKGVGHDRFNTPIPLGLLGQLKLGPSIEMTCLR